jgi:pimeloyl-ACP methyl ester carboxylesterase
MIVFVHGVPETAAIWDKVRAAIGRDSVAVSLPGFGCERPEGFGATKDDYVDWLVRELQRFDEPVDLVGHDWGAGLTYRIASAFPDVIRSWVADVGNIAHPDYVWHAFAHVWQTPGEGEASFDAQLALAPEDLAAMYATMGIPADDALEMASGLDTTMAGCILPLYRSAIPNCHADWGPWRPSARPGLVLSATSDPFGDVVLAGQVAGMLGAEHAILDGVGHFWPYESPAAAAALLESFWSGPSGPRK